VGPARLQKVYATRDPVQSDRRRGTTDKPYFAPWTRPPISENVSKIPLQPAPVIMPIPQASQALARFTVLDLTRVRSGPTCVRQLADWGANVIKVEMPPDEAGGEGMGGPREGFDFRPAVPRSCAWSRRPML